MTRLILQAFLIIVALSSPALAQAEPLLRAGDVVALSLPGEQELTGDFKIDREGKLVLPEVGSVDVAGLTPQQARDRIRERLSTTFQDLERLQLRLQERRLPLTVLGQVQHPGRVELLEDATIQEAINAAGGFAPDADLGQIQLRHGGVILHFDFEKYMNTGDVKSLPALKPLDTLFVPALADSVSVIGAVSKPGHYPWSDRTSLLGLIASAGGPSPNADTEHLQVINIKGGSATPATFNLRALLDHGGDLDAIPAIRPGATLIIPELSPDAQWLRQPVDQAIYVMGAVGAPGRYAFDQHLSLVDILAHVNGPTPNADLENVYVVRRGSAAPDVAKLNLSLFFKTGDTSLLPSVRPGDIVYVPGRDRDWLEESKESTVRILGAVKNPGRYRFDDSMTILDLLAEAGGMTADSYQEKIVVVNLSCCRDQARSFDLVRFAKSGDFSQLPLVRPGDTVYVPYLTQSNWSIFIGGIRDAVQVLSLVSLSVLVGGGL